MNVCGHTEYLIDSVYALNHIEWQMLRCDITSAQHLTVPNDNFFHNKKVLYLHTLQNMTLCMTFPHSHIAFIHTAYFNLLLKSNVLLILILITVFCQDIKENTARYVYVCVCA